MDGGEQWIKDLRAEIDDLYARVKVPPGDPEPTRSFRKRRTHSPEQMTRATYEAAHAHLDAMERGLAEQLAARGWAIDYAVAGAPRVVNAEGQIAVVLYDPKGASAPTFVLNRGRGVDDLSYSPALVSVLTWLAIPVANGEIGWRTIRGRDPAPTDVNTALMAFGLNDVDADVTPLCYWDVFGGHPDGCLRDIFTLDLTVEWFTPGEYCVIPPSSPLTARVKGLLPSGAVERATIEPPMGRATKSAAPDA